jgi:sec-independent protein translocase protein TatB
MFDLTSSKLLILGLVALIVVGPKDLPVLLRTIGKYVGMIRRQAGEFRGYFDEAMREQELANLKAEVTSLKRDVEATVSSATRAVQDDVNSVKADFDQQIKAADTAASFVAPIDNPAVAADVPPAAVEPNTKIGA